MTNKQDLRVIKTHQAIRQAFLALLTQKPYENISVQEIIETALVNRNTFYKYYSGKSALAGVIIDEFKAEYLALVQTKERLPFQAFISQAIPFFYQRRQLILALWKIKTKRHHLYDDMFLMIKQRFLSFATAINADKNWDYSAHLFATMMLTTAQYYFERDLPVPLDKILTIWQEMISVVEQGYLKNNNTV